MMHGYVEATPEENKLVGKLSVANVAMFGGYYIPSVHKVDDVTLEFDFEASESDMPPVESIQVNIPAGGGSGEVWEEITNVTLAEDVAGITITEDVNGQPFQLKKATVLMRIRGNTDGSTGWINLAVFDDTHRFKVTEIPRGFAATEGQDNYYTVRLGIELTEVETKAMSARSANNTSSKDATMSGLSITSTFNQHGTPLKCIGKFMFESAGGKTIGANTEICIYGVRV